MKLRCLPEEVMTGDLLVMIINLMVPYRLKEKPHELSRTHLTEFVIGKQRSHSNTIVLILLDEEGIDKRYFPGTMPQESGMLTCMCEVERLT